MFKKYPGNTRYSLTRPLAYLTVFVNHLKFKINKKGMYLHCN